MVLYVNDVGELYGCFKRIKREKEKYKAIDLLYTKNF